MDLSVKPELKREGVTLWWKPQVIGEWKRYGCCEWIPVVDDNRTWDEDIWNAELEDLSIWLDGGRGMSIWQCTLAMKNVDEGGKFLGHTNYMRDWFETIDEVQTWMLKACEIGRMIHASDDRCKNGYDESGDDMKCDND